MIPSLTTLSLTSPVPGAEPAAAQANGTAQDADFSALLDLCGLCSTSLADQRLALAHPAADLPEAASALPADGKILPVDPAPTPLPELPRDQDEAAVLPSLPPPLLPQLLYHAPTPAPEAASEDPAVQVVAVELAAPQQTAVLPEVPPLALPAAERMPDRTADTGTSQTQTPATPAPRSAPALAAARKPTTDEVASQPRAMPTEPVSAARLIVPQIGAEIPRLPGQSEPRLRVALPTARSAKVASEPAAAPVAITPGVEMLQPAMLPAAALAPSAAQPALSAAPQLAEGGPRPHDFTALVDRLVAARDTLQPQSASLAVQHADFGQISLRLRHDGDALSVALASADPDFARAVAAAPAPLVPVTTFDQGGQAGPRQDSQGTANSPSNGASPQSRGSASERRDDPPQHRGSAEPRQFAQQRAKGGQRGEIFA